MHIGLGGFHRAHMARYTHDLMGVDDAALQCGIKGAGLRASDRVLLDALAGQDGLYTLVEREGARENRVVIGSIVEVIDASESTAELLAAIDAPETRIVSLTVTENGYHLDPATKALNFESPAVRADLVDSGHPRTAPAILVEAYRRRRRLGLPAFTTLCCDNIQHNGDVLKSLVLAFANRVDPDLARWIEDHASFPNSMVDRITPVPTQDEIAAFCAETGLNDRAVLHAEIFRQWVVEDDFVAGRPAWEKVGVQFVDDVTPYELMKLRLLNTSHLAIAAIGQLCGYELIGDAVGDPLIRRYMVALMDRETGPTLMPVPGVDLPLYKRTVIDRFSNPAIRDTTQRVNTDAPVNYLLEPIRDLLSLGRPIDLLALGLAAWCRRVAGHDESGAPIKVMHPLAGLLACKAQEGRGDPAPILSVDALFGTLGKHPQLVTAVGEWLEQIYERGMHATIEDAAGRGVF
ncbi:mannitol dehydrogenase family protein [Sphingobium amiense]|uniref:mannitol dehydrogenase family protein n=1 Tax=Sphingobium amiense TaxID=135719 RepID=UPI001E3F593B|nr:mannitol dehydrogenase family protein [Sphingobium amiense]